MNSAAAPAPSRAVQLHAKASANYADKLSQTQALLKQAAAQHRAGDDCTVTQASSLGAEDVVITHLINQLGLDIPVFVLDTGALHAETILFLEQTALASKAPVAVFRPNEQRVADFVSREGERAMYASLALRKACCGIRKLEPLARALAGKTAWITGLRREQSGERAEVRLTEPSDSGPLKLNPLAHWTWGDVWHHIALNGVAHNPLHDRFFPSIGCAPCTRAISLGEDFRAGRWWWENSLDGGSTKECGLHTPHTPKPQTPNTHRLAP